MLFCVYKCIVIYIDFDMRLRKLVSDFRITQIISTLSN